MTPCAYFLVLPTFVYIYSIPGQLKLWAFWAEIVQAAFAFTSLLVLAIAGVQSKQGALKVHSEEVFTHKYI